MYLISAIDPLSHQVAHGANLKSPNSFSVWMLSHQYASMAESAWLDILGNLLVGTKHTAGDHFTMLIHTHAVSTTIAVQH
jgi:hypothetical protein